MVEMYHGMPLSFWIERLLALEPRLKYLEETVAIDLMSRNSPLKPPPVKDAADGS